MKHRMFALVFCTALAVLALTIPAGAEAVTGTCGEGIEWTYEDGTLTVSGSGPMENFEAAAPWDDYRGEITKAVISDGVTTVGDNAFRDYDALQEVSIGNDVTTLGKGSFLGCDALVRIHLPSSFSAQVKPPTSTTRLPFARAMSATIRLVLVYSSFWGQKIPAASSSMS